ncbi:hypothetical protein TrCOL_g7253 [Triparma columacea]|uniref:Uncharacterized protein n=1 Tax=Triparma columacea TaxID=722753 RepID=A0A9W7G3L2_9STRA|nr:hypothetical protein TrCOL_g7253 [Triparma columacea]
MDTLAAAAGSADSFAEEGANAAYEGFLERLAKRWGVPPEVIPIIMMSFGCFMDGISDITFLASMAVSTALWRVSKSVSKSQGDATIELELSLRGGNLEEEVTQIEQTVFCDDGDTCGGILATGDYFNQEMSYDTSRIQTIALVLLSIVCVKEGLKIVPFFHIYVSPHFHNPKNFQALHNSSVTWIVLLFSERWQEIAKDSLDFEKEAPAIIHILADVAIEDVPQLAFTLFLLVIGLRFPCFLVNTDLTDWINLQDCSKESPLVLDDGTVCYVPDNYNSTSGSTSWWPAMSNSIYFHDNGDIEASVCRWESSWEDNQSFDYNKRQDCETTFWWDKREGLLPRTDITYMNQCSSSFSSQSILPFCSCNGFGGGGIDGLMVFSLLMTIISTASKIWKLIKNIQKRHQNIEEAYKNKTSRGESGGISSLELNEIGATSKRIENPIIQPVSGAALDMRRLEKLESMLANVQKKANASDQELVDIKERLTKVEREVRV